MHTWSLGLESGSLWLLVLAERSGGWATLAPCTLDESKGTYIAETSGPADRIAERTRPEIEGRQTGPEQERSHQTGRSVVGPYPTALYVSCLLFL